MAILSLKILTLRRWKLLVATIVFVALMDLFQFLVLQPGIREDGALGSSLNASTRSAGFDEVKVMVLVGNATYRKRFSMRMENLSVNALSGVGEVYMDRLENATLNPSLLVKMTSPLSIVEWPVKSGSGDETAIALQQENSKLRNESMAIEKFVRRMRGQTVTFSEMNSLLVKAQASAGSLRRRLSAPDRELLAAKKLIKIAGARSFGSMTIPGLHASLFRNISKFQRSYELMERTLKIYIYKEGERPIFHQPRLRGIYCSEGWFMKLLERSRHFVVRDPRKAHLFYLPFSSEMLRITLYQEYKSPSLKKLERYLTNYVALIKRKYKFWNRTGGADHFFVGCHDWAPRITEQHMSSCIRALCNANIARGFNVGKDVSVPVTYIRSGDNPLGDIGGNQPSEKPILAFFAGGMHGYLRPLLLQYWENKSPDMKILGPMQRDIEGKAAYRGYMKQSKYCICARGYGVHTPRVVESIYYECVPVIISDNYVPPFFEVLDWEAFSVFILEKDIPYLREILLSIPEERYLEMQKRVKMVQRHFLWHKFPEKYDLFHMILHSIWYNRVFQT